MNEDSPILQRTLEYRSRQVARRADLKADLQRIDGARTGITLEVGCGHGHFLTAYSHDHPDRTCIGVDISGDRIERALRKRQRARLSRLHFLQADARTFLDVLGETGGSIAEIFVLFPDPWPKSRHHKNRILQADFLARAALTSTPECRLYFRTDHRPYFDDAAATVDRDPHWAPDPLTPWPYEFTTVFQSRADTFHSLVAQRRARTPNS